ncbi:MAG: TetR/AcrR family transcriptional regulator [Tetrasphaera jenkinsii]|jgi:AcrR family transcriptional regulator|nr:TetR/AcrR family transcriptional regulator [Tetrasphaera jenkinsii]
MTATATGQAKRRQRTHDALVEAASALLGEGRTHATIEEITTRAGVGFGSFHNHFASREDLFREAVLATLENFGTLLTAAAAGIEDPAERFARSFRLCGRLAVSSPELLAPLDTIGTEALVVDRGLRPLALADLRRGVETGRFVEVDPELLLASAGGALLGLIRLLSHDRSIDGISATDTVTERVLCLLGVAPQEAHILATTPLSQST